MTKRLLYSLVLGSAAAVLLLRFAQEPGRHWFDPVTLIGFMAGVQASRNVHQPSLIVALGVIALLLSAVTYVLVSVAVTAARRIWSRRIRR